MDGRRRSSRFKALSKRLSRGLRGSGAKEKKRQDAEKEAKNVEEMKEDESKTLEANYEGLEGKGETEVFAWGNNKTGQLLLGKGVGAGESFASPEISAANLGKRRILDIAASSTHAIAVSDDGTVYGAGDNSDGQLDPSKSADAFRNGPKPIEDAVLSSKRIVQASCGESHSAVLTADGYVIAWGLNDMGQLGHSRESNIYGVPPRMVEGLREAAVQVCCTGSSTFILSTRGKVYSFGSNAFGILGQGDEENRASPKLVGHALEGCPIMQIAAGENYVCVVSVTGRVFAWGSNSCGQLGAGHTAESMQSSSVPISVEMSRQVTAVACGAEHTMMVTASGALYGCGRNSEGQLGISSSSSSNSEPKRIKDADNLEAGRAIQVVASELMTLIMFDSGMVFGVGSVNGCTFPGAAEFKELNELPDGGVVRMAAGGGSLYAITSKASAMARRKSLGSRVAPNRISSISGEMLSERADLVLSANTSSKRKSMRSLTRQLNISLFDVYTLNASFLKDNFSSPERSSPDKFDEKRNSCVEIEPMIRGLEKLHLALEASLGEEETKKYLRQRIAPIVAQLDLAAPKLEHPDQLRAFLILILIPFAHVIEKEHELLLLAVQRLPTKSRDMVFSWIKNEVEPDTFRINLLHPLQQHFNTQLRYYRLDDACETMAKLLKKLYKINAGRSSQPGPFKRLSHTEFYSSQLDRFRDEDIARFFEKFRKIRDARANLRERNRQQPSLMLFAGDPTSQRAQEFTIFDYPFVLSADFKRRVMQIEDQATQYRNLLFSSLFLGQPFFVLQVRRDYILEDTLNKIEQVEDYQEFKKPLKVKFDGEQGLDAGGVRKEFFQLLSGQLFAPDYGMFRVNGETNTIWFNVYDQDVAELPPFLVVGALIGLAIYNSTLIDVRFPHLFWRLLLDKLPEKPTIDHLEELDPGYARNVRSLMEYNEPDFEEVFMQNFEVSVEVFGSNRDIELIPGGKDIPVTLENRDEYVEALIHYICIDSVQPYLKFLTDGFYRVIPKNLLSLSLFEPDELELAACGSPELDFEALKRITTYEGGYGPDHPTIRRFWNIVGSFTQEEKEKFLKFTTGSPRAPVGGLGSYNLFKVQRAGPDSDQLPTSSTCFNTLLIPDYESEDKMKERLLLALEHSVGFGLE